MTASLQMLAALCVFFAAAQPTLSRRRDHQIRVVVGGSLESDSPILDLYRDADPGA